MGLAGIEREMGVQGLRQSRGRLCVGTEAEQGKGVAWGWGRIWGGCTSGLGRFG